MSPPPLAALLPKPGEPPLPSDAILDRFLAWVGGTSLSLYPAQEEAILELLEGRHVVLATPTGSGKSLVATALHFQSLARGERSFYTCPIKALVNEKFFALCELFGAERVGMLTGDASINRDAPVICCTAEILQNLALRERRDFVHTVVMDEFHYYGDKDRGVAWQVPLLTLTRAQFLLMSATLGDVSTIAASLQQLTGREVHEVRSARRPVPLEYAYASTPLHETVQDLLHENRAPVYLVNFSQRAAAEQAQNLLSIDVCTKEEKQKLKEALLDAHWGTPFGKDLKRLLLHGLGLHHAGLLPRYRRLVERLAQQGLLKVVSGTDTLGVGVNVPIRSVLFTQLCKFDGEKTVVLPVRDFQQIAGRAGRKGFDERGFVVAQAPAHVIENARLQQRKAEGKKVVLQKPPARGYVHWDQATFERLTTSAPERLESRFTVTHSLIVNLLQAARGAPGEGYRRLVELVRRSHGSEVLKARHLRSARVLTRSLLSAGVVLHERRQAEAPARLVVAPGLQPDFSLNHTLSLYLLEVLSALDRAKEGYALEVLSVAEAILESPEVVLRAQVDRLKGERVRELKAQGVEYEQRMEELEKVTWPKPLAEFIYGTFDHFSQLHPWVGQENIRPKSIARELYEGGQTFNEYVRDYGLQRSEGVLLRYLTDAWRTLVQNVPEGARTEELEDVAAYLLTVLKQTDSSLVEEWESLKEGRLPVAPAGPGQPPPRPRRDLAADLKGLTARVRAELHQVARLMARKDWEALAESQPEAAGWTAEGLAEALSPYFAQHPTLDTTPRARQARLTQLEATGPRTWRVRQGLIDPTGEEDWFLEGVVDLTGKDDPDGALVTLQRLASA